MVEMPEMMDVQVLGLPAGTGCQSRVEDAQETAAASLMDVYAQALKEAVKEVMHHGAGL